MPKMKIVNGRKVLANSRIKWEKDCTECDGKPIQWRKIEDKNDRWYGYKTNWHCPYCHGAGFINNLTVEHWKEYTKYYPDDWKEKVANG